MVKGVIDMLIPVKLVVFVFTLWVMNLLYKIHTDARRKRKDDPETYRLIMMTTCLEMLVLAIAFIIMIGE